MWHWGHHLWFAYFVPSLWGNGPEALVQTVVYATAAVILIPPFRKWVVGHFTKLHEKLDLAHEKMDHIIEHHPDIPPFEHKEKP